MSDLSTNPQYLLALKNWKVAKATEKDANSIRLAAEKELLSIVEIHKKGVNNFEGGLKITTGETDSWDNDQISLLYAKWMSGQVIFTPPVFPFKQQWKADNKALDIIREHDLALYRGMIEPMLTVKPKKPAFSIKEAK